MIDSTIKRSLNDELSGLITGYLLCPLCRAPMYKEQDMRPVTGDNMFFNPTVVEYYKNKSVHYFIPHLPYTTKREKVGL